MAEITSLLASWILTTAAIFALLAWDERRIDEAQLARAWPVASRRCAAVVFGILCVPVHFWRTRRSARGILLGAAWVAALLAFDGIVATAIDVATSG